MINHQSNQIPTKYHTVTFQIWTFCWTFMTLNSHLWHYTDIDSSCWSIIMSNNVYHDLIYLSTVVINIVWFFMYHSQDNYFFKVFSLNYLYWGDNFFCYFFEIGVANHMNGRNPKYLSLDLMISQLYLKWEQKHFKLSKLAAANALAAANFGEIEMFLMHKHPISRTKDGTNYWAVQNVDMIW